jgi:hypothetical protein
MGFNSALKGLNEPSNIKNMFPVSSRINDVMFCKFLTDCVVLTVMLAGGVFTVLRVKRAKN